MKKLSPIKNIAASVQDAYYGSIGLVIHKVDMALFKIGAVALSAVSATSAMAAGTSTSTFGSASGYKAGAGQGASLDQAVQSGITQIKEPAFVGLGVFGVGVGAFQVYNGISNFTKRSNGQGGQQGTVADDIKKIAGGGALAGVGGFAAMSSETIGSMLTP